MSKKRKLHLSEETLLQLEEMNKIYGGDLPLGIDCLPPLTNNCLCPPPEGQCLLCPQGEPCWMQDRLCLVQSC